MDDSTLTHDLPDEGEYVAVDYTPDSRGADGTEKGRVATVRTGSDANGCDAEVRIEEGGTNTEIVVHLGHDHDEVESNVHRYSPFSGDYFLGTDATIRTLD